MKFIFKLIFIVFLATLIISLSLSSNGHVILLVGSYRVDLSLIIALIIIVFMFATTYYLIRSIVSIREIPLKLKSWWRERKLRINRKYFNNAIFYYFAGDYTKTYRNANKFALREQNKDNKFLGLILALKSTAFLKNTKKRNEIEAQLKSYPDKKWQTAKLIASLEHQYFEGDYSLCLESIYQILDLDKNNLIARDYLLKVFLLEEEYDNAATALDWLIRHNHLQESQALYYKRLIETNKTS